jgi:hypothetical protein
LFKSSKRTAKKENQDSGYITLLNLEYMEYMRIENQDLMVRENGKHGKISKKNKQKTKRVLGSGRGICYKIYFFNNYYLNY